MKERIKLYGAILLLLILIPYMITLFFHGESMGLFSGKTSPDEQLEEQVLYLVSEQISGQSNLEAIKAQAVIARTQLCCAKKGNATETMQEKSSKTEQQNGVGLSGNQENLLANMETLAFCVEETQGEVLTYEGELISPEYHAVSGKYTRNATEVAGQEDKVYLQSVESVQDIYSEDYLSVIYIEKEELAKAVDGILSMEQLEAGSGQEGQSPENSLPVPAETILEDLVIAERDSAEYVTKVQYKDVTIHGEALREQLGLSSALFYFSELKGKVRILTKGLGHGLGLSQYGADVMATEGKTYEEILKYYYTGVEIAEGYNK